MNKSDPVFPTNLRVYHGTFKQRLEAAMERTGSLLCLGLDPELPPGASADQIVNANLPLIEATRGLVCAYKLNLAFYLTHGSAGVAGLETTLGYLPADIPTILDVKWSDIGNTSAAYARAAFETWGFDAITANPYLGRDALAPFLADTSRGVFILCRTSNPGAPEVQNLAVNGEPLYIHLARTALTWGSAEHIALVVGATAPAELRAVRAAVPDAIILAPGVGPQGGDLAHTLAAGLDRRGLGLLLPVSRAIARATDPRAAAHTLVNQINALRDDGPQSSVLSLQSSVFSPQSSVFRPQSSVFSLQSSIILSLFDAGCLRFGQFTLASGRVSPFYFDLRLLVSEPALLKQIGAAYGEALGHLSFDRIAAIPYAAMPIGTAVALHLNRPMIYPRKEVKSHGTGKSIEGRYTPGETAVVVDDVITSGGSKLEAIATLEAAGLKVHDIVVLIDREEGGREPLEAKGYRVHAVLGLTTILDTLVANGRIDPATRHAVETYRATQRMTSE